MNNFTQKSGRAYWHSITNLTCCSPLFKSLQKNSMKAMMFVMLFALGSGAMFAQLDSQGGDGEVYTGIDACINAIPEMTATSDMMTDGYNNDVFKKCSESQEDFLIHFVEEDGYGQWGVSTGFTRGSDNCATGLITMCTLLNVQVTKQHTLYSIVEVIEHHHKYKKVLCWSQQKQKTLMLVGMIDL